PKAKVRGRCWWAGVCHSPRPEGNREARPIGGRGRPLTKGYESARICSMYMASKGRPLKPRLLRARKVWFALRDAGARKETQMKIILIRHGEKVRDKSRCDLKKPLSEKGREE